MQTHVTTHQAEEDARNEDILIYLNGQIVPKAQAVVSVYDSGSCWATASGKGCGCMMVHGPF